MVPHDETQNVAEPMEELTQFSQLAGQAVRLGVTERAGPGSGGHPGRAEGLCGSIQVCQVGEGVALTNRTNRVTR